MSMSMVYFTLQIWNPWAILLFNLRVGMFDIIRITLPRQMYQFDLRLFNIWIVRPIQ